MDNKVDKIYSELRKTVEDFVFDEKVAEVFDDMLNRSIPGYKTIITMISAIASRYAQEDSRIYDLGCSHGVLTALLKSKIQKAQCKIVAVDNSAPLIEQCKENLRQISHGLEVDYQCEDVCAIDYQSASIVLMNFILQFVSTDKKRVLLENVFKGTKEGGCLILSEKIHFVDAQESEFQRIHHHLFKKDQGYSDIEITQKEKSLKNVLITNTIEEHIHQLKEIGYSEVYLWYQCFNFVSLLAIK